jgi:hypothetical protein
VCLCVFVSYVRMCLVYHMYWTSMCCVVFCVEWCLCQSTDIYKRLLLENREDLAVNVYVAMCYYKVRISSRVVRVGVVVDVALLHVRVRVRVRVERVSCAHIDHMASPGFVSRDVWPHSLTTTTCRWRSWRCTCNRFPAVPLL